VQAIAGRLTTVEVVDGQGRALKGRLSADGATWSSTAELLGFGARYRVQAQAVDAQGRPAQVTASVRVATPERVGASMNLSDGAVVGIGMPMVVRLTAPVEDRAALERRLQVRTTPAVDGAWSWTGPQELQYRPQEYWKPGTQVTVSADLEGVRLGDQQWGQDAMERTVRIGSANVYRVDVAAHTMQVIVGGVVRGTIPITTGKPGFLTRNGVKVIMSKERSRRMRSETVGIARNSSDGWDVTVDYAMRLTNSGEFIHAAPWSVRQQGRANVSHGCTGMSTANAKWLYDLSKPGDVVEYVNSPRPMTATNGYGAWNVPWERWRAASALSQA
jgi:lipoprotein-anchoring transpeptidase ErfK/SrfK